MEDYEKQEVIEIAEDEYRMKQALRNMDEDFRDDPSVSSSSPANPENEKERKKTEDNYTQWALNPNGRFSPVGGTAPRLPAGVYEPFAVPGMWGVERIEINSDEIYELPDMATNTVIQEAETFWASETKYRRHNLLYKRGIILYGPPGGGKTVAVKLLMRKLIDRDGIVLIVGDVRLAIIALKAIRRIEPNRNLITIFEDIDEIMHVNGESNLLSLLDGESNIDRVLSVATTNYPERLGARIINRPSRFDRRVRVGMPSPESRAFYLNKATAGSLPKEELDLWVRDTQDMSIAHLRELVAAVYCLNQPYQEVIERLQDMARQVRPDDEFKRGGLGFGVEKPKVAAGW